MKWGNSTCPLDTACDGNFTNAGYNQVAPSLRNNKIRSVEMIYMKQTNETLDYEWQSLMFTNHGR